MDSDFWGIGYIISFLVPLLIFVRCFRRVADGRIKLYRFLFALVSVATMIYDGVILCMISDNRITYDHNNPLVGIMPFALAVASFIFYRFGKAKERKLQADLVTTNSYDIMDIRGANDREAIDMTPPPHS